MMEIATMIARFGLPTVAGAVVVYIVLRGEVQFRYPRRPKEPEKPPFS